MKIRTLTQAMSSKGIVRLVSVLCTLYAALPTSKRQTRHRVGIGRFRTKETKHATTALKQPYERYRHTASTLPLVRAAKSGERSRWQTLCCAHYA